MENKKLITKKTLLWQALKELVIVIGIIALIAAIIIFFVGVDARDRSGFSIYIIVLWAAALFVLIFGTTILIVLPIPIVGLIRLHAQEKELQMKFIDEVKLNDIRNIPFKNNSWFIAVNKSHILAFRRDYIQSVETNNIIYNGHGLSDVHITTRDGKKINVSGYHCDIDDFVAWILATQLR
jgi:hypothetical protein